MFSGFRSDKALAESCVESIKQVAADLNGKVKLMHVCGTHEQTITHYGLRVLLPKNIEVVSGPGCPVCVTTQSEIDEIIQLARMGLTVTSFGDMSRVPGTEGKSLSDAKSQGCDVRIVYSISDAVEFAEKSGKEVVHMGVGFETTAPSTAVEILDEPPENFFVLCCHRLIPPAMEHLLKSGESEIRGFINPGHVSTITGCNVYAKISAKYHVPQVVAGFEPLDVLLGIQILLEMIKDHRNEVVNEYDRVVKPEGNKKALDAMSKVFSVCDMEWRGLGVIPKSGLKLKEDFHLHDARVKYEIKLPKEKKEHTAKGCRCADVIKGLVYPQDCILFQKKCSPENPLGPCMVSGEGACNIVFNNILIQENL